MDMDDLVVDWPTTLSAESYVDRWIKLQRKKVDYLLAMVRSTLPTPDTMRPTPSSCDFTDGGLSWPAWVSARERAILQGYSLGEQKYEETVRSSKSLDSLNLQRYEPIVADHSQEDTSTERFHHHVLNARGCDTGVVATQPNCFEWRRMSNSVREPHRRRSMEVPHRITWLNVELAEQVDCSQSWTQKRMSWTPDSSGFDDSSLVLSGSRSASRRLLTTMSDINEEGGLAADSQRVVAMLGCLSTGKETFL